MVVTVKVRNGYGKRELDENMEKKAIKNDIILIVVLLVIALLVYLGVLYFQEKNTKEGVAVVTIDGEEYGSYPLNVDLTERIELPDGSYNVLQIAEGKADVTEHLARTESVSGIGQCTEKARALSVCRIN